MPKEEKKRAETREPEEKGIEPQHPLETFRDFDEMWEDFMRGFWGPPPSRRGWGRPWWPRAMEPYARRRAGNLDLVDTGKEFEVRVEVPGIPKENLNINVTKDGIEISGKAQVEKSEEEERNYMIRERYYSEVYRRLPFPEEVMPEKSTASLRNGVLMVKVPKRKPVLEEKKHRVEVTEV